MKSVFAVFALRTLRAPVGPSVNRRRVDRTDLKLVIDAAGSRDRAAAASVECAASSAPAAEAEVDGGGQNACLAASSGCANGAGAFAGTGCKEQRD